MTLASDIRNIASEARRVISDDLDNAEVLKGLSKVCREKGIDWTQLKALVKAQEQDARDGGHRVEKIVAKAEYASAYADLLASKMNNKDESCSSSPAPVQETAASVPAAPAKSADAPAALDAVLSLSKYSIPSDGSIPAFLRRDQVTS